jgi:Na+/H+ antiporter NhaC
MLIIFSALSIITILLSRGIKVSERISEFSKGAGNKNILLMVWIFVLAGAFASSAKAMGAVDATVNLTLYLLPTQFVLAGLFVSACVVSLCMGTSVGTIVALMPIAVSLASKTDISLPLMAAGIVGGAFFGDNLSFISDTTIMATQSQGCKPSDKFRYNFLLVLPVAILVCVIYILLGSSSNEVEMHRIMWWKILPYLAVLVSAICGMNVMAVLLLGNILTGIVGMSDGSYSFQVWTQSMADGIMGMSELILISMMAGGIFALITQQGILDRLVNIISKKVRSSKGAEFSICMLVGIANIFTANNTVAILSVGEISKKISKRFDINPMRSASLLDITSCTVQGLLPYGAQLMMASSIAKITAVSIVPHLYYPMLMGVMVLCSIFISRKKKQKKE